jgi:hypothetical protein
MGVLDPLHSNYDREEAALAIYAAMIASGSKECDTFPHPQNPSLRRAFALADMLFKISLETGHWPDTPAAVEVPSYLCPDCLAAWAEEKDKQHGRNSR